MEELEPAGDGMPDGARRRKPGDVLAFEHDYNNKKLRPVPLDKVVIRDVGDQIYWIDVRGPGGLEQLSGLGIGGAAMRSLARDTDISVEAYPSDVFRFDLGHLVFEQWMKDWDFTVQKTRCLLGARFLISYHEGDSQLAELLMDHYVTDFSTTSKAAVFLVYEMFQHMLESYLKIHQVMQQKLKELDQAVITADEAIVLEASRLHTDFLVMREIDHAARNVLNHIANRASLFISTNTRPFLDNMSMILERLENDLVTDRQVTSDSVNFFVSIITFRMNTTMKKMAVVNVVLSGITLLAAIYLAIPNHGWSLAVLIVVVVWLAAWVRRHL